MAYKNSVTIVNDALLAMHLMHEVCVWMEKNGLVHSKWWEPKNMNRTFMLQQAEPKEFCVVLVNKKAAASFILQDTERNQSWEYVDKTHRQPALYMHWLTVSREFAGKGLPKIMVDFAKKEARKKKLRFVRLDADANQSKLMRIYSDLGFLLMAIEQDGKNKIAYFQMVVKT